MAVAATAGHKSKSVADPNAAYESMVPLWKKSRAIIRGERFVKDYDGLLDTVTWSNLLIPFSPSMNPQQYEFYKKEAELPGIVSQHATVIAGGLLRKKPQLTLPENLLPKKIIEDATNWIMNEFSQDGTSLVSFLSDALEEEGETSRAWVYVDHPVTPKDLSKEEQLQFKPYPVLWKAESMVNWRVEKHSETGAQRLKWVIVRDYEEVFTDNPFHGELLDTVWVHEINDAGHYQIRKFQKKTADAQVIVANGQIQQNYRQSADSNGPNSAFVEDENVIIPTMQGEPLTFIPAWPLNGSYALVEPMYMTLVEREIALYNKISRRNHLLYGAATYTPYIASDMQKDEFNEIVDGGLGSWIKLNKGDTIGVLDTPTAALADMDRSIAAGYEEIAKLGVRMLTPEVSQSGVALDIRNAAQTSQLGTLNTKVSSQFASIIAFMISWRYGIMLKTTDVSFELSADFNPVPLGADWLRLATEWYEKGLIPRTIWLQMLKQNDMLTPEYDDEKGRQEIDQDDTVFTSKEQIAFQAQVQAMAQAGVVDGAV